MATEVEMRMFNKFLRDGVPSIDASTFRKFVRISHGDLIEYYKKTEASSLIISGFDWASTPIDSIGWRTMHHRWKNRLYKYRNGIRPTYKDIEAANTKCESIW